MPYKDRSVKQAFQREWIRQRKRAFFSGKACSCGSTEALRLHHRDRSTKVSHKIWSWAPARFAAEAEKCRVLCEPCHRRIHAEERRLSAELRNPHGTVNRYKLGCRCDLCRLARRDKAREERGRMYA